MTYSVYVGTYGKYNNGSLFGKWLNLEDYADKNEFYEACQELHGPGEHEFMFQDFEDVPRAMISECHIADEFWDFMNCSADDDAKKAFIDFRGEWNEGDFNEAYQGQYKSPADWAEEFLESCGTLSEIPENLRFYFDFEKYARDAEYGGDIYFDDDTGHVFWRH